MSWADLADQVMSACVDAFDVGNTIYVPYDGDSFAIRAVFNDPYQEGLALDGAPFQTRLYRLGIRKADLMRKPSTKDRVRIGTSRFTIHNIEPDGEAGYVLQLHKE